MKLHPSGQRWINPEHVTWIDDSDWGTWGAAVNPSPDGVQVSPVSTPTNKTRIGLVDSQVVITAHSAAEIITAFGMQQWEMGAGMVLAFTTEAGG